MGIFMIIALNKFNSIIFILFVLLTCPFVQAQVPGFPVQLPYGSGWMTQIIQQFNYQATQDYKQAEDIRFSKNFVIINKLNKDCSGVASGFVYSSENLSNQPNTILDKWIYKVCGQAKMIVNLRRSAKGIMPLSPDKFLQFKLPDYDPLQSWKLEFIFPDLSKNYVIEVADKKLNFIINTLKAQIILQADYVPPSKFFIDNPSYIHYVRIQIPQYQVDQQIFGWLLFSSQRQVVAQASYGVTPNFSSANLDSAAVYSGVQQIENLTLNALVQDFSFIFTDSLFGGLGVNL